MCTTCGCGRRRRQDRRRRRVTGLTTSTSTSTPTALGTCMRTTTPTGTSTHDGTSARARARRAAAHGPLGAVHAPGIAPSRDRRGRARHAGKERRAARRSNRRRFADARRCFALNLVSSPGSGKTTLLVRTIEALGPAHAVAVIEGDQQTTLDADRIRATGVPAVQVNTGKGCHLDAHDGRPARSTELDPADGSVLFIENVGNLVCPAAFDLGEAHKVVILSVTEGEDKPLKYPDMFRAADLMLVNKIDLLPHLTSTSTLRSRTRAACVPGSPVLAVSATTGEGLDRVARVARGGARRPCAARRDDDVAALRRRVAELEARARARRAAPTASLERSPATDGPPPLERRHAPLTATRRAAGVARARPGPGRGLPALRPPPGARARARRLGPQRRRGRDIEVEGAAPALDEFVRAPRGRGAAAGARRRGEVGAAAARCARRAGFAIVETRGRPGRRRRSAPTRRLRRLPRRAVRPRRPALPLPVHQLHPLRAALHDHPRGCPTTAPLTSMAAFPLCAACLAEYARAGATAAFTPSRMPAPPAGLRLALLARRRHADRLRRSDRRDASRGCSAARSSRSRGSAASTSPATRATPRPWRGCARASSARRSPSR